MLSRRSKCADLVLGILIRKPCFVVNETCFGGAENMGRTTGKAHSYEGCNGILLSFAAFAVQLSAELTSGYPMA